MGMDHDPGPRSLYLIARMGLKAYPAYFDMGAIRESIW